MSGAALPEAMRFWQGVPNKFIMSGHRRVWDGRDVHRRTLDRWHPAHHPRNSGAVATKIGKKIWLSVTSFFRAKNGLKLWPIRVQRVCRLRRGRMAARIQCCHLFRRSLRHDAYELHSLCFPNEGSFQFSGHTQSQKADSDVLTTHHCSIWRLWCAVRSLTEEPLLNVSQTAPRCIDDKHCCRPNSCCACECSFFAPALFMCNWREQWPGNQEWPWFVRHREVRKSILTGWMYQFCNVLCKGLVFKLNMEYMVLHCKTVRRTVIQWKVMVSFNSANQLLCVNTEWLKQMLKLTACSKL